MRKLKLKNSDPNSEFWFLKIGGYAALLLLAFVAAFSMGGLPSALAMTAFLASFSAQAEYRNWVRHLPSRRDDLVQTRIWLAEIVFWGSPFFLIGGLSTDGITLTEGIFAWPYFMAATGIFCFLYRSGVDTGSGAKKKK